jgi:TP901 family phage tail tape measure protein
MPSPSSVALGLIFEIGMRGLPKLKDLGATLRGISDRADEADNAIKGMNARTASSGITLMNMVNGLQQLTRASQKMFTVFGSGAKSAIQSARDVETGLARIDIVMGKTGKNFFDPGLVKEAESIRKKVEDIGRETEFTERQAADAFVALKQAGLEGADALKVIDQVMAFTSASAGALSLKEAADVATLSMISLGSSVEGINKNMDMFVRAQNITKTESTDFLRMMRSMRSVAQTFVLSSPADLLAVATQLRSVGRTAKLAGKEMVSTQRSLNHLQKFMEKPNSERFTQMRKLFDVQGSNEEAKKQILAMFLNAEGEYLKLPEMLQNLQDKVTAKIKGKGTGKVSAIAQVAFGNQDFPAMILGLREYAKKYKRTLRETSDEYKNANGNAAAAQQRFLDTTDGMLLVLGGSWEGFKKTIGDELVLALKPVVHELIALINKSVLWMKANGPLLKTVLKITAAFLAITGVITAFAVALASAGVILMAVGPMFATVKGYLFAMTGTTRLLASGLFTLARVTFKAFSIFGMVAGLAYFAYEAFENNLGGLRDFVLGWAKDLKDVFTNVFHFLSGRGLEIEIWDSMSKRAQKLTTVIVQLAGHFKYLWKGLKEGFLVTLKELIDYFDIFDGKIVDSTNSVIESIIYYARWNLTSENSLETFKKWGKWIGKALVWFVAYKVAMLGAAAAMLLFHGVVYLVRGAIFVLTAAAALASVAFKLLKGALWVLVFPGRAVKKFTGALLWLAVMIRSKVIMALTALKVKVASSVAAIKSAMVAGLWPLILLGTVLGLVIWGLEDAIVSLGGNWVVFGRGLGAVIDILLAFLGPLGWTAIAVHRLSQLIQFLGTDAEGNFEWSNIIKSLEKFGRILSRAGDHVKKVSGEFYKAGVNWVQALVNGFIDALPNAVKTIGRELNKINPMNAMSGIAGDLEKMRREASHEAGRPTKHVLDAGRWGLKDGEYPTPQSRFSIGKTAVVPFSGAEERRLRPPETMRTNGASPIRLPPSKVEVKLTMGDIKLNMDSMDEAGADKFVAWIADKLGDTIGDKLTSMGIQ